MLALTAAASALAQELPAKVQALLFKKILLYDRSVSGKPKLLVAYADEAAQAGELVSALQEAGFDAAAVKVAVLSGSVAGATGVYVFPHAASAAVKAQLASGKLLGLSGSAPLAERGDVAVALSVKDGKPEIVVNLTVLHDEGHALSSELLNLARVVK